MRNIIYLLSLSLLFATACGSERENKSVQKALASGDMEAIKELKGKLSTEHKALENNMALLDSAINAAVTDHNYPLISVNKVKKESFKHYLELQGDVKTKQNLLIYPEMAGTLLSVKVTEGQQVTKGQLLGIIDNGGMSNQLAQVKTQLALAKTTFERQKNLWDQEVGTEIQYLQAKTNYEAQESAYKQMQSTLSKFELRAPFTGIIDDVIKDEGTVVAPGGPGSEIFRIVNLSNMYVEVPVPENYIDDVKVGKSVNVYFPVLGDTISTKVRQTGNFIDPANRSFSVEVSVPNKDGRIKPNLTAKVQINDYSNAEAILVPQSIISENAEGDQYVYIVANIDKMNVGVAKKLFISTGMAQGDYIEVSSGIKEGQSVIIEGARTVRDNQKVKILNKK